MSYTLLLADDSVTTHRVMELTFAGQDIRVVSVADGEQALERMRTLRPDILLAEAALPRVDGYQLAEHVRRTPELAGVPVLLLTGAFDVVDEPRAREAGAVGTIVKPFEPEVVIKRVKDLLGISRRADPAPPSGRLITSAEPPPQRPPAGPRGVGPPRPVPPPRQAHIPTPPAPWDELRQQTGLPPDTAHVEGPADGADDYFDQLDETFDSLDKQLSGSSVRRPAARPAPPARVAPPPIAPPVDLAVEPPVFEVDREWFGDAAASHDHGVPAEPVAPLAPSARLAPSAPLAPEHRHAPVASVAPLAPNAPGAPVAPAAPGAPVVPVEPVHVADAFEALLAAEQGMSLPPPPPVRPQAPPSLAPEPVGISEAVVERIAARVAERLSEGVFLDTVTRIVTAVAERLVREEIARIRAKAEEPRR